MISANTKKIFSGFTLTLLVFLFCLPFVSSAISENPAPKGALVYICTGGEPGECTFADLIAAVKHIVDFGAKFALGFSVVVIAVAGGKYMIYADNQSKRTEANKMLLKVVYGIGYILAAWLIVTLILKGLEVRGVANEILK